MMKRGMILVASLTFAPTAHAFDWNEVLKGVLGKPASEQPAGGADSLSSTEINAGLKEALTRGADAAVSQLGRKNGFFGNAALKIPLPPGLQKAEKAMRLLGMGKQADELVPVRVNTNFASALLRESDGCKARRAGKGNPLPSVATPQTRFLAATRRDGVDSGACLCRNPLAVPALRRASLRGLHPESAPSQA